MTLLSKECYTYLGGPAPDAVGEVDNLGGDIPLPDNLGRHRVSVSLQQLVADALLRRFSFHRFHCSLVR